MASEDAVCSGPNTVAFSHPEQEWERGRRGSPYGRTKALGSTLVLLDPRPGDCLIIYNSCFSSLSCFLFGVFLIYAGGKVP